MPVYKIDLLGNPNSCLVKIGKQNFRSLVDSGAEVSLIHSRAYQNLKDKPKLMNKKVYLQSASSQPMMVDGSINVTLDIRGVKINQKLYVVRNLNRSLILGRDWLKTNGVRLYYDLGCLRIGHTYIPLEEDIHIATVVRIASTVTLRPQTGNVCTGHLRHKSEAFEPGIFEMSSIENGYVGTEPGLMIANIIVKPNKTGRFPVMIINNTNKTLKLKKGCVIGKVQSVTEANLTEIKDQMSKNKFTDKISRSEISVPSEHSDEVTALIFKNADIFAASDADLGHTDTVKMKIDTGDHPPIKLRPYRTPLNNRKTIDKVVDEMMDAKIISRSKSPWSFPVVIVDKKDGSKRFCVDFRKLNKITKLNSYPLPLIDDILALLGNAKYFTSLDLKSGYWQVLMDEADKEKTAFTCHRGLFQFNVMPFGLSNAPAIFQELMSIVLADLDQFAIAYLDDILIFSSSLDEHLGHIQQVFDRLRQHDLRLKLKKCHFLQAETNYLGFVINQNGIKPDPKKVEAIQSISPPTSVREVRGFIGMCSYYRRFIPNFSGIAEPIISLTKKYAKFKWSEKCQTAFEFLKNSLTLIPHLVYPDVNKPYTLYTDASDTCIGACLTQPADGEEEVIPGIRNEKPIYYLSHKLSDTQRRWSTIEKEAFAIHFALQKLDHYLHNAEFTIRTDHKPLKYLLESPMQNKKIQLWALSISGYNCKIEYIAGPENTCADLLSRLPSEKDTQNDHSDSHNTMEPDINENTFEINAFNSNLFKTKDYASCEVQNEVDHEKPSIVGMNMIAEQEKDTDLMEIKMQILHGQPSKSTQRSHIVIDNILYYISDPDNEPVLRLYVPGHLREWVVKQYHDDNGHMGIDKTFDAIRQKYHWPNLYKMLYEYVTICVTCQERSMKKIKPPLQETDIPPYPFAKIGVDLSGPYPTTLSGNKYIIGFIDLYSGWPEAFAVPDKSADNIAHLLIDEIFPRFGAPLQIISDNGTENVNSTMKETMEALNIDHVTTSFYHPQGNAKIERFHRTLHDVLAKKINENSSTWDLLLNQTLAAIRFNISESSKFSPYFLLYNRDVVLPIDNLLKPRRKYQGEAMHKIALEQQHKSFMQVHNYLKKAKRRQAKYADKNSKDIPFEVGDPVYLKNHIRKSKLDRRWNPYWRIIKKTSPVTFLIRNQLDGKTTKTHAEHLRKANIEDWDIPMDTEGKPKRRAAYVVPPDESETDDSSDDESVPLAKLAERYRKERENSDNEDNIPQLELRRRLNRKSETDESESKSETDDSESMSQEDDNTNTNGVESDQTMDIDPITQEVRDDGFNANQKKKMKKLLQCIAGIL